MIKLTEISTHYQFGENWSAFVRDLPDAAIDQAVKGMLRLVPRVEIQGQDVLDIGCGSGLHTLAALQLGAQSVTAIDIDPYCVATTKDVLTRFAGSDGRWSVSQKSVFEMDDMPLFPVVYSWGVLHHTGNMRLAIHKAAERVAPGGHLYLAVYRKTPLCGLWRMEKWLYTNAPRWGRNLLEVSYISLFQLAMKLRRRNFRDYVESYVQNRGMVWRTDVKDWLGGYPYESISEQEMLKISEDLELNVVRRYCRKPGFGLFGTGCDEYAFRKMS